MNNEINDIRDKKDFSKLSFSNFKKADVTKELIKSFKNSNYEAACYWTAELVCGGHFIELWECIILYMSKSIHIGNPKLPIYISSSINNFKNIIKEGNIDNELNLRNNIHIRKLFSEISTTLVVSNRKHSFADNKVSPCDFDVSNIGNKLKAPHVKYIKNVFKEGDNKEIYIALNELYYNISDARDSVMACYWIEWIVEFDILMRKGKKKITSERRSYVPVNNDDQLSIIWSIWDIFLDISKTHIDNKIIDALLNIFCLKYSKGIPKKRKYIMYFIVSLLTERVNYQTPLVSNMDLLNSVKDNTNIIYKEIKKNEIMPKENYLNANMKTSKEKSIEKMRILENVQLKPTFYSDS